MAGMAAISILIFIVFVVILLRSQKTSSILLLILIHEVPLVRLGTGTLPISLLRRSPVQTGHAIVVFTAHVAHFDIYWRIYLFIISEY